MDLERLERWEQFNKLVYLMLKLAYINALWILFTIVGLGVFGIFPATAAMFSLMPKLINKSDKIKIFPTFWAEYKSNFFKLNGIGLIFAAVIYFLYYDFTFLHINTGTFQFLYPILILITISTILTLLFFFPVFVHFKLKFFQYFKQALLIAITSPIEVIQIILVAVLVVVTTYFLPGIIPLFPGSVFAYVATKISFKAFDKIKVKKGI